MVAALRERIWLKITRLPVSYFDQGKSGETVSRIVNDTSIVRELISNHFPNFSGGIISIFVAVTILFIMDWKMTLLMLVAVPIVIAIMTPLGRQMVKVSKGMQDETAHFSGGI